MLVLLTKSQQSTLHGDWYVHCKNSGIVNKDTFCDAHLCVPNMDTGNTPSFVARSVGHVCEIWSPALVVDKPIASLSDGNTAIISKNYDSNFFYKFTTVHVYSISMWPLVYTMLPVMLQTDKLLALFIWQWWYDQLLHGYQYKWTKLDYISFNWTGFEWYCYFLIRFHSLFFFQVGQTYISSCKSTIVRMQFACLFIKGFDHLCSQCKVWC